MLRVRREQRIGALTKREVRDLWYAVARAHLANGDVEKARQARVTARLLGK